MAFGDVCGIVVDTAITCRTPMEGDVHIRRGDALILVGPYTVSHGVGRLFGVAMESCDRNDHAIPVCVHGVRRVPCTDNTQIVVGDFVNAGMYGFIRKSYDWDNAIVLKIDCKENRCDVLF